MRFIKAFILILTIAISFVLSGCATSTVTTHYGIFEAQNTAGEQRLFRLYWQVFEYDDWNEKRFKARPLVLETQCSQRVMKFYDDTAGEHNRCHDQGEKVSGITSCARGRGFEGEDGRILPHNSLCAYITDRKGSSDLLNLEGELILRMECRPAETEMKQAGETINIDTLLRSDVPYIVATKKVVGREIEDIDKVIPEVSQHSTICDPDA